MLVTTLVRPTLSCAKTDEPIDMSFGGYGLRQGVTDDSFGGQTSKRRSDRYDTRCYFNVCSKADM